MHTVGNSSRAVTAPSVPRALSSFASLCLSCALSLDSISLCQWCHFNIGPASGTSPTWTFCGLPSLNLPLYPKTPTCLSVSECLLLYKISFPVWLVCSLSLPVPLECSHMRLRAGLFVPWNGVCCGVKGGGMKMLEHLAARSVFLEFCHSVPYQGSAVRAMS